MTGDTGKLVGDAFSPLSLDKGLCAWIDLLGTSDRGFPKKTIEQLIDTACIVSSIGSFDEKHFYTGVSNARANVLLVGDAICITQKSPITFKFVRDSVALVTIFISQNLFTLGYSHRGAIAEGSLEVGERNGIRYVSGTAVLRALEVEKSVKTTGLVVAQELEAESNNRRRRRRCPSTSQLKKETKVPIYFSAEKVPGACKLAPSNTG